MRRVLITLLLPLWTLVNPAGAETARVYSGEHPDFTRLVVELPAAGDWILGRTAMGYAFATAAATQPDYNLSQIWARIPKSRLQAVRIDPATGALQMTLACDCHIFPFEYGPGVVVLDVKPGPAPDGSAFEAPFAPFGGATPTPSVPQTVTTGSYDWLSLAREQAQTPAKPQDITLPMPEISLAPLRDELLEGLSRGAAQGVVEMAMPGKPVELTPTDRGTLPWSQIHIGVPPGVRLDAGAEGKDARTPEGAACIPDKALAIADWGGDQPPLDLLADARSALYGEFDLLDPDAALRAVRHHLYLGFGAEAGQYAKLLTGFDAPKDLAYLQSMARVVDGDTDPQSPFQTMLGCDGTVAFWGLMAEPTLQPGTQVNADAVVRSFLALPAHLRASLGEGLADRLLAIGDAEAARIVRNTIKRTPDVPVATMALMDAKADLHEGKPDAAMDHAETAVNADGSGTEEWIALVEAHFQKTEPMTPDAAQALRAFGGEIGSMENAPAFHRALTLAEALAGETDAAFATAKAHDVALADLWQVAVAIADDDAFLRHAVEDGALPGAQVLPETSVRIADRLVTLGFADAALTWLEPTEPTDGPEKRRIAARAAFALGDARKVIALLDGLEETEDAAMRAKALVQLGQIAEARAAYQAAGLTDEALQLAAWEGAWTDLKAAEAPLWAGVVGEINAAPAPDDGPLARGTALLEATAASRAAIDALLAGVAPPAP